MLKSSILQEVNKFLDKVTQNLVNEEYCKECNSLKRLLCYFSPCKALKEISDELDLINGCINTKPYRYKLDNKLYFLISVAYLKPEDNRIYLLNTTDSYKVYAFNEDYFQEYFTEVE